VRTRAERETERESVCVCARGVHETALKRLDPSLLQIRKPLVHALESTPVRAPVAISELLLVAEVERASVSVKFAVELTILVQSVSRPPPNKANKKNSGKGGGGAPDHAQ
jgi:hypothetical protein